MQIDRTLISHHALGTNHIILITYSLRAQGLARVTHDYILYIQTVFTGMRMLDSYKKISFITSHKHERGTQLNRRAGNKSSPEPPLMLHKFVYLLCMDFYNIKLT